MQNVAYIFGGVQKFICDNLQLLMSFLQSAKTSPKRLPELTLRLADVYVHLVLRGREQWFEGGEDGALIYQIHR